MSSFYSHFFSKKFQHICVSFNVNINESLTNDIVSFEQLGPDLQQHLFHQRRLRSACAYALSVQSLRRSNVPSIASRLSKEGWTRTCRTITKTYLYNFDPLKPHFYIVKLGFPGIYIIFLISAQKHRLWVLVRTASTRRFNRVPTIYVLSRNMKNIIIFYVKNCHFLVIKFSVYLNRRVFVMLDGCTG